MSGIANKRQIYEDEIIAKSTNGMPMLILNILLMVVSIAGFVGSVIMVANLNNVALGVVLIILCMAYFCIIGPILFAGLKVLKPNEALVLTLFGKYYGTLKGEGFFFVNPFTSAAKPEGNPDTQVVTEHSGKQNVSVGITMANKKISLKTMTLDNAKQKVNDELGNPIEIGIVVFWKVVNTAEAMFNVDDYKNYLSTQCDSALRNVVRRYPYDVSLSNNDDEKSLRGSSQEVAEQLKEEIQARVNIAGLEIIEARITHLAYAPEIAAAMLQRQQASAIIAARQMIVEGAVGMVEMALSKLSEGNVVNLDEERKAAMVSNLLVVLCGNKDAQPIVNSGSIY